MPSYSTSVPSSVISQEATPSVTDYKFWIKPSTNEAFFSDGSAWTEIPTGGSNVSIAVIENTLSILELQSAGTITPDISAQIASDLFSDSTGYKNTIDAGNTTAFYNLSDAYNNAGTNSTQTTGYTGASGSANTTKYGMKIVVGANDIYLKQVTLMTNSARTKCYVLNSSRVVLHTADVSSYVANFNVWLTAGTTYYIATDQAGVNSNFRYDVASPYPIAKTGFNYTAALENDSTDVTNRVYEIVNLILGTTTDLIVQTNMETLPSTPSKFIITAFRIDEIGTGGITADISFDNGAHYQTGLSLNTEYNITDVGAEMILKINLNAGASAGFAECQGYGVLFW